jgi:chromosome segregation ATPase
VQFTQEDLDRTFETVKAAVGRVANTLYELDAERERRAPEAASLTDGSAAAWADACQELLTMWASYQQLAEKVAAVEAERSGGPLGRDAANRIGAELVAPSMQADLNALSQSLERTAETMTSLWAMRDLALPRLEEIEGRLAGATGAASRARIRIPNEATSVLARVRQLRVQVANDPLGVAPEQIADLSLSADRINREIHESVAQVDGALTELAQLSASIDTLCQTLEQARTDAAEARQKVTLSSPSRDLDGLAARAEQLRTEAADAGRMLETDRAGVARVVARLAAELDRIGSDAAAAADEAAAPLARRRELRGRLDAYRAKAIATGRAEDVQLENLYESAVAVLYQAPCDLDEAERTLVAYQSSLIRPRREEEGQ